MLSCEGVDDIVWVLFVEDSVATDRPDYSPPQPIHASPAPDEQGIADLALISSHRPDRERWAHEIRAADALGTSSRDGQAARRSDACSGLVRGSTCARYEASSRCPCVCSESAYP